MQDTNFYGVSQEFIAAEVLKFYGLAKDTSQKTDWQKMLKFGRKKRDRVDHILVGHGNFVCFIIWFILPNVISYCGPLGWPFRATCPKQIQGKSRSR